jgi:hypothetical protein
MNKTITGIIGVLLLGILSIGLVTAFQGNPNISGPDYSEERCTEMRIAFESLDYHAWSELMTANGRNSKVLEVVNEDNFALFAKAHEAMKNGDFETAKEIRADLGLGQGNKHGGLVQEKNLVQRNNNINKQQRINLKQ